MLVRIKRLSKDTLVYGLGGALARSISILLLLIYAPLFGTQLYGVLNNITATSALLLALLVLGLDGATGIFYFETDDPRRRTAVTSSWFYFSLLVSLPTCALLLLFAAPLAQLATRSPQYANLIQLSIIAAPFALLGFTFNNVLRMRFKPLAYVALTLLTTLLNVGVGLYLVLVVKAGLTGAVVASLASALGTAMVGWWLTRDSYTLGIDWPLIAQMLRTAWPFTLASVALWVNNYASGPLLVQLAPSAAVGQSWAGIYGATLRLSIIVALAVSAFQLAWSPYALSIARQPDASRTYAKILTYFSGGFGGLALALGLFAREALRLLDRNAQGYVQGFTMLGLICYASVALGAYYIVSIGSNITKHTFNIGGTTMVAAACNVALNYALIPQLGFLGAAIATLAANLIATMTLYFLSQRCYPIPYEPFKALAAIGLGLGLMLLGLFVNTGNSWLDAVCKIAILCAYAILLLPIGVVTPYEASRAIRAIRVRLTRKHQQAN